MKTSKIRMPTFIQLVGAAFESLLSDANYQNQNEAPYERLNGYFVNSVNKDQ